VELCHSTLIPRDPGPVIWALLSDAEQVFSGLVSLSCCTFMPHFNLKMLSLMIPTLSFHAEQIPVTIFASYY